MKKILDEAEKNMGNPDMILAFVLVGIDKNPKMRLQELLHLKDIYDQKYKSPKSPIAKKEIPMYNTMSRAERRATDRKNKKKNKNRQ